MSFTTVLVAVFVFVGFAVSKFLYETILRPRWYLRHIHGPPREGLLLGHVPSVNNSDPGSMHRKWHTEHGTTIRYDGPLMVPRLCTSDKRALQHVLVSESYKFPKPNFIRRMLAGALGEGLLIVEGADHKRQRKIMNPSFGPAHVKAVYPVFLEKAHHLRDTILKIVQSASETPARVDLYDYANRTTLDVIGAAGFGYEINAIDKGDKNELAHAFTSLFSSVTTVSGWGTLTTFFPILEKLPFKSKRMDAMRYAKDTMDRIGAELVEEKKRNALATSTSASGTSEQLAGRDLLSVLVKANMASDLKVGQRLTDKDVAAQISTFLLAGADTTANALCWAIYALCKYPTTQTTLREEVLTVDTAEPTYDEINALPYLDAVVRETLRLFSPVQGTSRDASEDCIIPLSESIVDRNGVTRTEIFIAKNTAVFIPIAHMNTNVAVWGPDAREFKPERWLPDQQHLLPEGVMEMPSVACPTFIAGPRACIGFRFTLFEMKAVLFTLIRAMKFELADPVEDIEARNSIVTRPRVRTRLSEGWQLPILITLVDNEA